MNRQPETATAGATEESKQKTGPVEFGRALAASHRLEGGLRPAADLRQRPAWQEAVLSRAYRRFRQGPGGDATLAYAAEWLLDNYYLVRQAIRLVRQDLPSSYYQELPRLATPDELRGLPRIYGLARAILLHDGCQLDLGRVSALLAAYQKVAPLTMGELWALPIMLRLGLLESLAQAMARLTDQPAADLPAALRFDYASPEAETVANAVPGLRLLGGQDWERFFEGASLVEARLREDPAGIYAHMNFATRDRYRKVVEELARRSGQHETDVAQAAVDLARVVPAATAYPQGDAAGREWWLGLEGPRTSHVGYYLAAEGRTRLEEALALAPPLWWWLGRWLRGRATAVYVGSILALVAAVALLAIGYAVRHQGTAWPVAAVMALALVPALTLATDLVNWIATMLAPPTVLPKLDFEKEGIAPNCRPVVVIPALLTSAAEARALVGELELHYLRNPDRELAFALLADLPDAPEEQTAADAELIEAARQGIEALNSQYGGPRFHLFFRRRLWNPREGVWMGWERKRGKLHEFNRLLRGATDSSFAGPEGQASALMGARYVITLDADTVLPRDAAARLVATLAHPLNQAHFDERTGRVTAGYTVLQPRTAIKPTSASQSHFTRIFAGDTGLDPYTLATSDVYQDLFGEGTYVGKGIYNLDAFERSLAGRAPENSLLSHDLFEGIHGRAGLVTDVVLYEDYPPHYLVHVRRSHRWIRGDWQLLPWLSPLVPLADGRLAPTPLALIDVWKIADNLRRSLLAPSLMLLFVAGWAWLPGSPWLWTLSGMLAPAGSVITQLVKSLVDVLRGAPGGVFLAMRDSAVRWLLALAFLPYEAILAADAILTTLYRLLVTRRHRLQWTTAAHAARLFGGDLELEIVRRQMLSTLLVVVATALVVYGRNPAALLVAAPLMLAWLLSPEIAYLISRPATRRPGALTAGQRQGLRRLARRTWLFFAQFVGPDDNWLPPDHFQESPRGVVAHRTSPTNIGLYLLSAQVAYDLGYIGTLDLALRLRPTFETLARLERHRGHFLNWIDTQTLEPLNPRYVSTVDSGNLAACLLALRQGCLQLRQQPAWRWRRWEGLLDTLALLADAVDGTGNGANGAPGALRRHLAEVEARIRAAQEQPEEWPTLFRWVNGEWRQELDRLVVAAAESGADLGARRLQEWQLYVEAIHLHLSGMQRELDMLLAWLAPLARPPAIVSRDDAPESVRKAWQALQAALPQAPTVGEAVRVGREAATAAGALRKALQDGNGPAETELREWCDQLVAGLQSASLTMESLLVDFEDIARQAEAYFQEMEFGFLYNEQRQVFHIGYNLDAGQLDNSYYDLLASEARIASLVAIARYQAPQSHWLHLARPLARLEVGQALLSWSGTMFEYLMPTLLLRSYEGTLLHQSLDTAIRRQMAYGRQKGVPWGISESGYFAFDAQMNYQYRAFGVPDLGFKRGLSEDLVVTPYASILALPFYPQEVYRNLEALDRLEALGRYGYYEAIDFTQSRLGLGQEMAVVRSYMAHHQGMIMLALANYLADDLIVKRLHDDPRIQSVDLLLQERIPKEAPVEAAKAAEAAAAPAEAAVPLTPWPAPVDAPMPQVHYLSNGRYQVMVTAAGAGYSQWQELALTRWRADTTLDDWGSWLYVRDDESGALWSATFQPTAVRPDGGAERQEALFHPHMVEFRRRDRGIAQHFTVTVAPDEDVELRVLHLTNDSAQPRRLTVSSYGEVVLAPPAADERHPAFTRLFVESEFVPEQNGLLFRRRPRSNDEEALYLVHALLPAEGQYNPVQYESDRAQFLGRYGTARRPLAFERAARPLTGTIGATLDPIFALAQTVELPPHSSARLAWLTAAADTRSEALRLAETYRRWGAVERAFSQARARSEEQLRRLGLETAGLRHIQQLLSLLLYPHQAGRPDPAVLASLTRGQSGLWGFGISGDYPIILLRLKEQAHLPLLVAMLQAHTYWRERGPKIDLVALNLEESNYGQRLQGHLWRAVQQANSQNWLNRRGGIFLLPQGQMSEADGVLLQTAARVVLDGARGPVAAQLAALLEQPLRLPEILPTRDPAADELTPPLERPVGLLFDNGRGGFSPDGREYVIYLNEPGQTAAPGTTPAPWINVIANPDFGFLVSESGGGYSWAVNSGENRLTPWSNDPVADPQDEALYLRDEETTEVWTPTPQPAPAAAPYVVRHGAGYTIFESQSHGLRQTLRLFAAPDGPVKIAHLRLENLRSRPRRLTATYYAAWVLGATRPATQPYLVPEYDQDCQALLARNPYSPEFSPRVAFLAGSRAPHGLTADRAEFLGRMGSRRRPAALSRIGLQSLVEAGLDACGALQLHLDLAPEGVEEIFFLLGQGADRDDAKAWIGRYQSAAAVAEAWEQAQAQWEAILGAVQVETPEPAMNLLLNRWLLYQTVACRLWGRSAFYQSSGAYGFRDQLQDVMSLTHARPALARDHLLRAAGHQFEAGDVLHWWHPPDGRGVRTRISDDLLWLPYVTAHYVEATGDESVLHEMAPFLKGPPLEPDVAERYAQYESSAASGSLFEHCCRALARGDTAGPHGLPLIGAGDWNDGMNRVGVHGQGESVWLGWFLHATLTRFAGVCERLGRPEQADSYRQRAADLAQAVEASGWDGGWYRRAYYDDGTPLGSAANRECQIDAIAQSWAVLSGAADPARARQAMDVVLERLVRREEELILLLTPPFDRTPRDPGYIKGYVPGIRENGGQYTHAALWTVWALADMGEGELAVALFRLLNPIYHADTAEKVARYRVEPYVVAADVYGVPPHTGRGGWTWYTGSSGWMYRLGLEAILGLRRQGDRLQLRPCIPRTWPGYRICYRHGQTHYEIVVENPDGVAQGVKQVMLDGRPLADGTILLSDDGGRHRVKVRLG